ncbi:hypothetical protein AAHZ94_00155 [Streptomyces sp. HSW2009]|uniref:hypothetical protein n=1 Tax=Streptomyces sp. HSW2009 TaxID=3142890 RepID=UPI0032EF3E16
MPPGDRSVAYELSELGGSLSDGRLAALGQWAVDHADQLLAAQERHSTGIGNGAAVR